MKLLLTSAGLSNKSISNALLELTERPFSELNLAFIPTASNVEEGDKDWVINDLIYCKNLGFKSIDIVDISAIPRDLWFPRLQVADVLMFEGGNTFHLMHWLEKSGLKELLPEMLKTKVYVGISAGAMVTSRKNSFLKLYYQGEYEHEDENGLGLVDFQIRPHLNSPYFSGLNLENLEKIAKDFPETFYALDDNSAIKIEDGKIEIISEGVWKKFN
ncbi:MAG: Type 1 glutamine amidotransferase-like domain-containing protein [Candidatus Moraniibacteriota bacterium]